MTTPKLKVIEEKPDINKVQTCNLLDKSAMSRNLFTKEECERIIEMGRTWEQIDAQIQTKNPEAESEKNDDYRNCKMYGPPVDETESWLWIGQKISTAIYNFNSKDGWKFNLIGMAERPMMMEYEQGGPMHSGGKYDWHIDLGPSRLASTRKLGFSLFLNDDYEGGEFQFKFADNKRKGLDKVAHGLKTNTLTAPVKGVGSVIVFPSYLLHRVKPVTKGTRYSLVVWSLGPPFK